MRKTMLNARVNVIFYFLTLILSFFSRKIFLDMLGADFIGLTSTLQNILCYINIAELGISTAIGYLLYKPIFDSDKQTINEIISVLGYIYSWLGKLILALGIAVSLFFPLIFPNTVFELPLIYFAFFSFLTSSLIGYFCNYKQTLLGADQRNYEVIIYYKGGDILKTIIQISLAYYTQSYYLWVFIELLFGILYSIILNWRIAKIYPWLQSEIKEGRRLLQKYPAVISQTKKLFVHRISATVQYWTVPILIYSFASLQMVAYYGNYTIITDKLSQFVNGFFESPSAGVGNLIAEGNKNKIMGIFWELLSLRYFTGATIGFAIYRTIEPFITLWLGEQYLLGNVILILIILNIIIGYTRGGIMQFVNGYGLFYDIWAAIAEIIINLSVAIGLGSIYGLPGVLMGGITSQLLIVNIWKPIFLYTKGFKEPVISYWLNLAKILVVLIIPAFVVAMAIDHLLPLTTTSYPEWALYAFVNTAAYAILAFSLLYTFSKGFRALVQRLLSKFQHK